MQVLVGACLCCGWSDIHPGMQRCSVGCTLTAEVGVGLATARCCAAKAVWYVLARVAAEWHPSSAGCCSLVKMKQ